jgi:hypothetical protein
VCVLNFFCKYSSDFFNSYLGEVVLHQHELNEETNAMVASTLMGNASVSKAATTATINNSPGEINSSAYFVCF